MPLLVSYSYKNILARKLTSTLTVFGIGLVVFVFCAVLMLSNGLGETLIATGEDDNAIVIRKASQTEVQSIIYRDVANAIKADAAIRKDPDGTPIVTSEILVLINQPKRGSNEPSNVPVRGVSEMSIRIRPAFELIEGRMWRPGTSEIIAGAKVAESFQGCGLGETVRFGMRDWTVVGIFETGGSGFESELWGDVDQLMDAFGRPVFSSLTMQLTSPDEFDSFKARLEGDPRYTAEVMREKEYYEEQSRFTTVFINAMGVTISIIFSLGAIVGAMITMYAAVANRTTEIGTLRALGFGRRSVLFAFLIESLMIALIGGAIGILGATFLRFVEVSTTNWNTFAELAFSFEISTEIVIYAFIFAVVMGFVGGFLPAVRAARFRIVNALRAK
ncbi:MAG: ABC transporter permease [Candidatus Zixiibacteriota bacterium]|nr:MAG: ABC transporter permease [candidate division Zixibacteria bacterium]